MSRARISKNKGGVGTGKSKSVSNNYKSEITKTKSQKTNRGRIIKLVVALILAVLTPILFVGATSGWFTGQTAEPKTHIDTEFTTKTPEFIDLTPETYESLTENQKSFVVFVDQIGCKTAVNLKTFLQAYMNEHGFSVYQLMFSDLKQTSLYEFVKYYPSIAIIDHGRVRAWLKADSDEDAAAYNSADALSEWLDRYLEF